MLQGLPPASQIVASLAELARTWWPLATAWHVYFAGLLAAMALGWRPAKPVVALLLALPLASVVAMAWLSGNRFTTLVLGSVLAGILIIGRRLPGTAISFHWTLPAIAGLGLVLFGLVYPHFLDAPLAQYLYAAPVGIVPCPTLATVVGFSALTDSLSSRSWGLLLGSASLFYGVFGATYLGVALDWTLVAGALMLMLVSWKAASRRGRQSGRVEHE